MMTEKKPDAKRQISIRVSPETDRKIQELSQIHATQTEVIAVAIDRYYQQMEGVPQMNGKEFETVTVEFSPSALFDDVDSEANGIDEQISIGPLHRGP